MKTWIRVAVLAVAASAFAVTQGWADDDDDESGNEGCGARSDDGRRLETIGLTSDQRLICFSENDPDDADDIGPVTGLAGDTALVGIDFRPPPAGSGVWATRGASTRSTR